MGRLFFWAGHGEWEGSWHDAGTVTLETATGQEMILLRDVVVLELRRRSLEVFSVPDNLSLRQTIDWINEHSRQGDVAIEIHANLSSNVELRGATVFYIAKNLQRQQDAELVLKGYLQRVPEMLSHGVEPDTATGIGHLAFCRQVFIPSLLLEVGFLSNPDDLHLLQIRREEVALGLADGLEAWVKETELRPINNYPVINLKINGEEHADSGILVKGNFYIPIDVVDIFDIDPALVESRLLRYHNVVFIRATDLRDHNIEVGWEVDTQTLTLLERSHIYEGLGKIMGRGLTTASQLVNFLRSKNELALSNFPHLTQFYVDEAQIESVNHDVAFCQMCLETGFLNFGGDAKPEYYNFAGMGAVSVGKPGLSFPDARTGVRAHIQLLKGYASKEPLVQTPVKENLRLQFIKRGIAPTVHELSRRWASDPLYAEKLINLQRQLYEEVAVRF